VHAARYSKVLQNNIVDWQSRRPDEAEARPGGHNGVPLELVLVPPGRRVRAQRDKRQVSTAAPESLLAIVGSGWWNTRPTCGCTVAISDLEQPIIWVTCTEPRAVQMALKLTIIDDQRGQPGRGEHSKS